MKKAVSVILLVLLCLAPLTACRSDQSIDFTQFKGKTGMEGNSTSMIDICAQNGFIYYFMQNQDNSYHLYEYDIDAGTSAPVSFIHTDPNDPMGAEPQYGKESTYFYYNILAAGKYFITLSSADKPLKRINPSDIPELKVSNIDIYSMDGRFHKTLVKLTSKFIGYGMEHPNTLCLNYKDDNIFYLKYGGGGPLCSYNLKTQKITELAESVLGYSIRANSIYYLNVEKDNTLCKMDVDGRNKRQIGNQSMQMMQIAQKTIFYFKNNHTLNEPLYSMDLDGSNSQEICGGVNLVNQGDFISYFMAMTDKKVICMVENTQDHSKDTFISIEKQSDGSWKKTHDYHVFGPTFTILNNKIVVEDLSQSYLINSDTGEKTVLSH